MRKAIALAAVIGWTAAGSTATAQNHPSCGTQASAAAVVIKIGNDAKPDPDVCEVYEGSEVRFVQEDNLDFTTLFVDKPSGGSAKKFTSQQSGKHKGVGFVTKDVPDDDNNPSTPRHPKSIKYTVTANGQTVDPMLIIWPK